MAASRVATLVTLFTAIAVPLIGYGLPKLGLQLPGYVPILSVAVGVLFLFFTGLLVFVPGNAGGPQGGRGGRAIASGDHSTAEGGSGGRAVVGQGGAGGKATAKGKGSSARGGSGGDA